MEPLPILYSFRRCPYAIRARMAIGTAGIRVAIREVVLRDKPASLMNASAKGTVPVLVLPGGKVLEESLAIMVWALEQQDPLRWLHGLAQPCPLINENDGDFKYWLDRYKYADRHPEHSEAWYRDKACQFLARLESTLEAQAWLAGLQPGFADVAIFPFIRQFAGVDTHWFANCPYPRTRRWLEGWLGSEAFTGVMAKYPRWEPGDQEPLFPDPGTLQPTAKA